MTHIVSTTDQVLLSKLDELSTNGQFFKREVVTRALAISAIFFRTIDALANFMIALAKCGGRLLRASGVKAISIDSVSNASIRASFKAAKESVTKDPLLMFKLLRSPKTFFETARPADKDWKLKDHFGHIYVINLEDTPKSNGKFKKRLDRVTEDLHKVGCDQFERLRATYGATDLLNDEWKRVNDNSFNLVEGSPELDRQHKGQAGCYMSHYRAIKDAHEKHQRALQELQNAQTDEERAIAQAKVKEYSTILILEDDNGFGFVHKTPCQPATVSMAGAGKKFKQVMSELPQDWDMLYLVSVECGPDGQGWMKAKSPRYSDHLNRLEYGLLTNAVAINSHAYPKILEWLSKIEKPEETFRPVDHAYAHLHKELKVFVPNRPLAYQAPGDSAITTGSQNEPWDGTWDRGF